MTDPETPDSDAQQEGLAEQENPAEQEGPVEPEGLTEVVHERLTEERVVLILEAALQAANEPLTIDRCQKLFRRGELPVSETETQRELIKRLLEALIDSFADRGVELKRVASGYRLQVRQDLAPWVSRLWEEKPPRYSRALLETLSLIAYRQPVTRGDIELVRGVAVSSSIIRTLQERSWIREVGHREVPGRPALYGTTREFLDYFNLKTLSELPPLAEIRDLIQPVVLPEVLPEVVPEVVSEAPPAEASENTLETDADADADVDVDADAEVEVDVDATAEPEIETDADSKLENAGSHSAGSE